jgi:hypothetical protein
MRRVLVQINNCILSKEAVCDRGHLNLELGDLTLRSRSLEKSQRYVDGKPQQELNFSLDGQRDRFIVAVPTDDPSITFSLRRERFLFRSVNVALARLSLATMTVGEPTLFELIDMIGPSGAPIAYLEIEALLLPNTGEVPKQVEVKGTVAVTVGPSPKPEVIPAHLVQPSMAEAPVCAEHSPPLAAPAGAARRSICHRGTMTDSIVVWPEDVGENVRAAPACNPPPPLVLPTLLESKGELPLAALAGPDDGSVGDAGLKARKKAAVAWPADEMEGLMLYCEMLQNEKRIAEARLAQYHLTKALSVSKKLCEAKPVNHAPVIELICSKHDLNAADSKLVAEAFHDI